jgi:hypothetical protein
MVNTRWYGVVQIMMPKSINGDTLRFYYYKIYETVNRLHFRILPQTVFSVYQSVELL